MFSNLCICSIQTILQQVEQTSQHKTFKPFEDIFQFHCVVSWHQFHVAHETWLRIAENNENFKLQPREDHSGR